MPRRNAARNSSPPSKNDCRRTHANQHRHLHHALTRTYDEQNALYEQGRSKAGRIVTNARGGYSNHNFGIAFDIGVFEGGRYLDESPAYKAVGALGMKLGLEWGGNWKTIQDEPHFQLRPAWAREMSERDMLAELRHRLSEKLPVFAV